MQKINIFHKKRKHRETGVPFNDKSFRSRLYQSIWAVYCVPCDAQYFLHPFSSCSGRTDPREVAQTANLFVSSSVQFGRSVGAQSAAAQSCGRGTSLQNRHKKKNVFTFFLARLWIKWTNNFDKKKKQIRSAFLFR